MSDHDDNEPRRLNDAVALLLERLRQRPLEMTQLRERVRSAVSATRPASKTRSCFRLFWVIAVVLIFAGSPFAAF